MTQTKSAAGRRTLALPEPLVADLKRHRATQAAERLQAASEWSDNDLVFSQRNGRPCDPRADLRDWKNLLQAAGVPPFRLHDARHSAATFLLVQQVDPRVVMDLMGWTNPTMLRRYQHVMDDLRAEAATRMGEALFGA